ncbi:MAG: hypothetical protein M1821_010012 [Bathelium mastoideum]|nr:MAG: hypothetical protein M1821_010012 [Bathelium mastoideum]
MRSSVVLSCLISFLPLSFSFPATNFANLNVHDPCIVQNSGKYYAFSTGGLLEYYKADSLNGPWASQGSVFSKAPNINNAGNTDLWAPDLHQVNGVYYLYYAASTFGSQTSVIGLATSTSLNVGSWTDHGAVISSPGSQSPYTITNAIDPNLIVTPSGSAYLNWGSFWADIWQVPLESGLATPAAASSAVMISEDPSGNRPEEGSYMSYHAPYYYLWVSHGQCCGFTAGDLPAAGTEYKIIVGRSTSVNGPFVDESGKDMTQGGGTVIMGSNGNVYAPGGQGVVTEASGQDVLYYHYCKLTYTSVITGSRID